MVAYFHMDVTNLWPVLWRGVARTRNRPGFSRPSSSSGQPGPRYWSLDGLRGYLALAVVLSHASIWYFYLRSGTWEVPPANVYTQFGQGSVTRFFMITGFCFGPRCLMGASSRLTGRGCICPVCFDWGLYLLTVVCVILVSVCRAGFEWKESPPSYSGR